MVGTLRRFWDAHSHFLEGLDWLERFVARAGVPTDPDGQAALAHAWTGVLVMSHRLDRFERAREAGEAALALRRAQGDKASIAGSMMNLANPLTALRDYGRAQALYEESLALYRAIDDRPGQVFPLLNLGGLYYDTGRPREALAYFEASLALSREVGESDYARGLTWNSVGDVYLVLDEPARAIAVVEPNYQLFTRERSTFFAATCVFTLGRAEWRLGKLEAASAHLEEAERLFRAMGSLITTVRVRYFRASLALANGDAAAARRDLERALNDLNDLVGQSREREYLWCVVERAGTLACQRGDPERAARLYAAAIAHRDTLPGPLEPSEREMRTRDLEHLRKSLGAAGFAAAVRAGRDMSLEQAAALAREALQTGS
jgi:tetratricopeptide (TPR) repeat protein